jgi:hypothetical protein
VALPPIFVLEAIGDRADPGQPVLKGLERGLAFCGLEASRV